MIITKYPDYVEDQLKMLDEKIAEIYKQETPKDITTVSVQNVYEIERRKQLIYERVKPLLDEKVRLIQNSCPSYIVSIDR